MLKKVLSLLIILSFMPGILSAKTITLDFSQKNQKNAIIRSVILPGWGQLFLDKKIKGYILMSGAALSAAIGYYYFSEAGRAYDKYERTGLIRGDLYSNYETKANSQQIAIMAYGLLLVYALVDLYIYPESADYYAAKYSRDYKKDGISFAFDSNDLKLVYKKTF